MTLYIQNTSFIIIINTIFQLIISISPILLKADVLVECETKVCEV